MEDHPYFVVHKDENGNIENTCYFECWDDMIDWLNVRLYLRANVGHTIEIAILR